MHAFQYKKYALTASLFRAYSFINSHKRQIIYDCINFDFILPKKSVFIFEMKFLFISTIYLYSQNEASYIVH